MSEKIQPTHRERAAYVYIRQSTATQVRYNRESQARQYALRDHACELGFAAVVVIDDDLGRSGSGVQERPGFERLVAAVCRGQVGAVLSVEASRLARNNRDWHTLVDLCALTDALVIDHDGIYDPKLLNDRLLLGLKGTMSEFELGLIRQRSQEALRRMIARGEVLTEVPVGFVRTRDNRCELCPDRRVQQAIQGVFSRFRELGSVRQVLLWYRQERILLPLGRPATCGQEFVWRLPIYSHILGILKNPAYAGAFVYGRRTSRTVVVEGRARRTSGHDLPRSQWRVLLRDHHPGYISWDEFEHNQGQLEANAGMRGLMKHGAAKSGPALLAGLLRCGRCGRKLHVGYSGVDGRVPRYFCRGAHLNHGESWCISVGGLKVDRTVEDVVLEALEPAGVAASLEAARQQANRQDEKREALRLAAEQARYETERVQRQYNSVEPENRLVAAELESRWNSALERQLAAEAQLAEVPEPSPALRASVQESLLALGKDVRAVWNHPAATPVLKKRILRTVLEEIVIDRTADPPEVHLIFHWVGGVHTQTRVACNRSGQHQRSTDREVIDVARDLACVCEDSQIARILNMLGYRTGAGNTWNEARVRSLRSYHQIPKYDASTGRPWLTADDVARCLGIAPNTVLRMIRRGVLPAKQVVAHAPWVVERGSLELPQVRAALTSIRERGGRSLPLSHPNAPSLFPTT
jgi:DNA invertase Pin-like site-specific DNA recombinase